MNFGHFILGNNSIYSDWIIPRTFLALLMLSILASTMILYAIFFRFMYKHDNNERLKRLLGPEVIRRRNQQNAVTFFGQFCDFVLQTCVIVAFVVQATMGDSENKLMDVLLLLRSTVFAIVAATDVFTSNSLRTELLQ